MRKRRSRTAAVIIMECFLILALVDMVFPNALDNYKTWAEVSHTWIPSFAPLVHSDYLAFTLSGDNPDNGRFDINALGYRGIYPLALAKGAKPRVLLLGDSFTFGHGLNYADSYAGQLQAMLPEVEVIDAGYHNTSFPDGYYAYLRREGLALQPDMIVVNVFIRNDIEDMQYTVWRDTDETGAPTSLYTLRLYPDMTGAIVNLDTLPWYYGIPGLRDRRPLVGLAELFTRLTGHLPEPTDRAGAERKFRVVMNALHEIEVETGIPVYVYAFDNDNGFASGADADAVFVRDVLARAFPAYRVRDDIGEYDHDDWLLSSADNHFNRLGAQHMAERVYGMIAPVAPYVLAVTK